MSDSPTETANPPAPAAPSELFADLGDRRQRAFLAGFVAGKGLKRAEELSDVSSMCHYQWMKKDAAYRECFRLAKTMLTDEAEDEAYRRAFVGYDTPIVHAGKIIGSHKRYSDSLAQFMLKGMRPRVYREGMEDLPMGPTHMTIRVITPEEQEKRRAEERAKAAAESTTRTISIPGPDADSSAQADERQTFDNLKEKP
ncbi:MAG TPA: hypothetical protein VKH64_06580 [Candidatus Binatia bacterium]|nr:hypothetical protein [Candidatus Binatia bacterium]